MKKSSFMTALEKTFENDCNDLSDLNLPQIELSSKFQKKMTKLIQLQKKPYFTFITTAKRRAACFIAVLLIVIAFWVKSLRKQFKTLC